MARDELRVGVVHHARHFGLGLLVGEEDVGRREGDHLHVDADAVHVLEAPAGSVIGGWMPKKRAPRYLMIVRPVGSLSKENSPGVSRIFWK